MHQPAAGPYPSRRLAVPSRRLGRNDSNHHFAAADPPPGSGPSGRSPSGVLPARAPGPGPRAGPPAGGAAQRHGHGLARRGRRTGRAWRRADGDRPIRRQRRPRQREQQPGAGRHTLLDLPVISARGPARALPSWKAPWVACCVGTPAMAAAGPGSAYLTGPAAEAAACDAVLTTMVTGQIDWAVAGPAHHRLAHRPRPRPRRQPAGRPPGRPAGKPGRTSRPDDHPDGPREHPAGGGLERPRGRASGRPAGRPAGRPGGRAAGRPGGRPAPPAAARAPGPSRSPAPATGPGEAPAADEQDCGIAGCLEATRRRLQATILRWSLDLLSGPGGLASQLRGTLLGAPFNTPSQPLDLGRTTRTIPPRLRTAVIQRDQHCQFPRLHPATVRLRRAPPDPLGQRRPHQPGKPPIAVPIPPPRRDPPMALDNHLPPRRHHHRHRTRRPHPPQPRTTPASRLTGGETPAPGMTPTRLRAGTDALATVSWICPWPAEAIRTVPGA